MQYRFGLSGNENKLEGGVKNLSRGVENKMRGKGTENKFLSVTTRQAIAKKLSMCRLELVKLFLL